MQQNSQISPEKLLEKNIRNLVSQVSRQKLLPKILWNAARQFGSKKLINYQKSVRKQYENQLKNPLKYDPEQAKSDRQKFRDKVVKLMNNQLEIDYLQNLKLKDRTLITYQGKQLEQCKIPTKKQYQIFKNFNQKKFKQTYSNLFQDKLEVDYDNLYQNKSKKRCHTLHILENKQIKPIQQIKTSESILTSQSKEIRSSSMHKTPKKRQLLIQSARKKPIIYFNQKKIVGSQINHNEIQTVIKIMKEIGKFDDKIQGKQLCLTKQSIYKWMKSMYDKPNRIYDFLEFPQVLNVNQFWAISKKLRVMPLQHVLFMTFLYFDGNNDGYIDDYDLERLSNLSLTRNVLKHDFQKMKQSGIKKMLTKKEPYLDLYKLSEVTETKYFDWKKKNAKSQPQFGGLQLQMKNRVLSSKQKHIFLDFQDFCYIYRADKPFLWYDLMYVLSGTVFQGLKYD